MPEELLVSLFVGYLIGSMPSAYLVAKAKGVDILRVGTGNPGAANTFRQVGRAAGIAVFLIDIARGAAGVLAARWLGVGSPELEVLAGAAVVAGHWYPLFLKFRGGAGLAPSIGVAIAVLPLAAAAGIVPALVLLKRTGNTGNSAGLGFAFYVIVSVLLEAWRPAIAATLLAALVLLHARLVLEARLRRQTKATP